MEEVHRKREREGRGFWTVTLPKKKEKKKKIVFYVTEPSLTGVYYRWPDIFKSVTKQKHRFTSDVHLAHYSFFLS